jgi:hypothetical protein
VNVIGQHSQAFNRNTQRIRLFVQQFSQSLRNRALQHLAPVFGTPDKVVMQGVDVTRLPLVARRTDVLSIRHHSMLVNSL